MASRKRDNPRLRIAAIYPPVNIQPLIKIQKIDTPQVDRQYKMNKETNNRQKNTTQKTKYCFTNPFKAGGGLVCSGSLCSPSTIDTYHDTVKTTRTSYDMEFVLDTTKTQINTCKCEHKYSHS